MAHDAIIIGGGIIGLAVAREISEQFPGHSLVVLEKEPQLAMHQSGRNSGVLHSGIYYKPNSLKAINCIEGKQLMQTFCDEHDIPYRLCGKVIVATAEKELPELQRLYEQAQVSGINCRMCGVAELREIEPHVQGLRAIHVPEAGVVDFRRVVLQLGELLSAQGHSLECGVEVQTLRCTDEGVRVRSNGQEWHGRVAINCAGLYADRLCRHAGHDVDLQIIPFRGEYRELINGGDRFCRGLIYPVPDPRFPFLGIHLSRGVDDRVTCGPNAVLAASREGYTRRPTRLGDLWETLSFSGFRNFSLKHWKTGISEEYRSLHTGAFLAALQKLVPDVDREHLISYPAGIRAQALDRSGKLLDDFRIESNGRAIHVLNAPSPAATASLRIGRTIVDQYYRPLIS